MQNPRKYAQVYAQKIFKLYLDSFMPKSHFLCLEMVVCSKMYYLHREVFNGDRKRRPSPAFYLTTKGPLGPYTHQFKVRPKFPKLTTTNVLLYCMYMLFGRLLNRARSLVRGGNHTLFLCLVFFAFEVTTSSVILF